MEENWVQLVLFGAIVLISIVSSIVGKLNQWLNEKRMQVEPRAQRDGRRQAEQAITRKARAAPKPAAVPRSAPARPEAPGRPQAAAEGKTRAAETILRQLEEMLAPEVAEARRKMREAKEPKEAEARPPPRPEKRPQPAAATPSRPSLPVKRAPRPKIVSSLTGRKSSLATRGEALRRRRVVPSAKIREAEAHDSSRAAYAVQAPGTQKARGLGLGSIEEARRAILMHEILGPPVADRL
jgi:hypothetical protein